MAINSCNGCMPPKRYPGCHSVCEDYLKEVEKNELAKRNRELDRNSFMPNRGKRDKRRKKK